MPAPTLIASYSTTYTTTGSSKNVSVSALPGDMLIVYMMGQNGMAFPANPTASGLSFKSLAGSTSSGAAVSWAANVLASISNLTLTMTESSGTAIWGFTCLVYRNCKGVRTIINTTGTGTPPSRTDSMFYANSALVVISTDASAQDGSARTWRTVNSNTPTSGNGLELTYATVPGTYTAYAAAYPDTGATGSKTYGLSAPTSTTYHLVSIEIIGQDSVVWVSSAFQNYAASTSRSVSLTVDTNPNRMVVGVASVGVQPANGTDASVTTTMTCNGLPMTSITKVHSNNGSQGYIEVFYYLMPPSGTNSINLTASTSVDLRLDAFYLQNVDQVSPFSVQTATGSSTAASLGFSNTLSRKAIILAAVSGKNITSNTSSPSEFIADNPAQNFNNTSDGGCARSRVIVSPANAQTSGFGLTSGPWALVGLTINPTSYFPPLAVFGIGL